MTYNVFGGTLNIAQWINLKNQQKYAHQSVFSVQMKNCDPFVFAPLLAIDSVPVHLSKKHVPSMLKLCDQLNNQSKLPLVLGLHQTGQGCHYNSKLRQTSAIIHIKKL